MKNTNYTSIITLALACAAAGVSEEMPDVSGFPEEFRKSVLLHYQLMVITKAVNGAWVPTMENTSERKYFPWYWIEQKASGLGLSFVGTAYTHTAANLGSRLLCETSEQAEHVANTFLAIYEEYLLRG